MKIVVFGPEKRVGALHGEHVVDLSLAFTKFVKERQDERQPDTVGCGDGAKRSGAVHRRWRPYPWTCRNSSRSSLR